MPLLSHKLERPPAPHKLRLRETGATGGFAPQFSMKVATRAFGARMRTNRRTYAP